MAQQKGIIKIKGTVGDLTFYKSQDGFLVRQKGGIEKSRIASDPAFARTRENGREFAASGAAAKLVQGVLRPMLLRASDARVYSRLLRVMSFIKNMDSVSARGDRNVGVGIGDVDALELLKGFDFNNRSSLASILFKAYVVNPTTGEITIPNFVAGNDVVSPQGATHIRMRAGWAKIDFGTGLSRLELSNEVNLPINNSSNSVMLTLSAVPTGPGTNLHLLQLEFFQEVNGVQYSLKNGAFNVLCIVEAS